MRGLLSRLVPIRQVSQAGRSVSWLPDERGSIVPLLSVVLFVAVAASMSIMAVAGHAGRLAQAQWAADAAALATAAAGQEAPGKALAEANGAVLISVSVLPTGSHLGELHASGHGATTSGSVVVVEVERGGIRARAAAVRVFAPSP